MVTSSGGSAYREMDVIEQFRAAMSDAGLHTDVRIVADGRYRRFALPGEKRGKRAGWYRLFLDGLPAGAFGSWKDGTSFKWHATPNGSFTPAERAEFARAVEERRKASETIEREKQQRAARRARIIWDAASKEVLPTHPYLVSKGIWPHGIRQDGDRLVIPVRDPSGTVMGVQYIDAEGSKLFHPYGTKVSGGYHRIGEKEQFQDTVVICEGYATGASIHEATLLPIAVAFNAGNLESVALAIRAKQPEARIIVAGDVDASGVGQRKAIAAAASVGGVACFPPFKDDTQGTDWNDYARSAVAEAVQAAFSNPTEFAQPYCTSPEASTHIAGEAALAGSITLNDFWAYMPAHNYIFTPSGEPWPAASVDARIEPLEGDDDKPLKASKWLDKNRSVEQMVWAPGLPKIIENKLVSDGGFFERPGARLFNLYRPPALIGGANSSADLWLEHVHRVYPAEAEHIIHWLAHRVQRPGEKINHALVLGGSQGIGKDTLLEPVKAAVGSWNFAEVSPKHMLGRFNSFVKSVILRVSEARDLGDTDRYSFYDHMKTYTASPPDVLRCDEKHLREHSVLNVCGVIITTNHKTDGIYLPADDRRHFVAWSEVLRTEFADDYWQRIYGWYAAGGISQIANYLHAVDLSKFNPKAPPPKTPAFYDIVDANRSPEDAELADVLDKLGNPSAVTINELADRASESFKQWLTDRRNSRQIPHRLESAGYVKVRNEAAKDGLYKIGSARQAVYAKREMSKREQLEAANAITRAA